jgi:hypothetical protein
MPDRPDVFHWNTAIELDNTVGSGRAAVIGLSMVSEQLDRLIELLAPPEPPEPTYIGDD